jgi:hypothetical protein
LALRRPHLTSSPAAAAAIAGAALLAAACSGARPFGARIAEELTCTPEDLGGAYFMQTAGEFSTRNLADLADDAPKRKAELETAGLRGGRFNYWKQEVGKPPFESPLEVVCQVMEFGSADQAARFVGDLQAEPRDLATMAITWLPAGGRKAEELSAPNDPALPPGTRAFRLEAASPEAKVSLYAVLVSRGRYVQSVYLGNGDGTASPAAAAAVLVHLTRRSAAAAAR